MNYELRLWQTWNGDSIFFNCTYKVPDKDVEFHQGDVVTWKEFIDLHDCILTDGSVDDERFPKNYLLCVPNTKTHDPDYWEHQKRKAI